MLNILIIARDLVESGFKREQAEAIAHVVADVAKNERVDLASKDFVRNQFNTVRTELSALRGTMNTELSRLETRLMRWIVGTGMRLEVLLVP